MRTTVRAIAKQHRRGSTVDLHRAERRNPRPGLHRPNSRHLVRERGAGRSLDRVAESIESAPVMPVFAPFAALSPVRSAAWRAASLRGRMSAGPIGGVRPLGGGFALCLARATLAMIRVPVATLLATTLALVADALFGVAARRFWSGWLIHLMGPSRDCRELVVSRNRRRDRKPNRPNPYGTIASRVGTRLRSRLPIES